MATRINAIVGETTDLTIEFREDDTGILFDPFEIIQVDILDSGGKTILQTIASGSVTRLSIGKYRITADAIATAGVILDKWKYRLEDGGATLSSIEITNIAALPTSLAPEQLGALPRFSAVIERPILLVMEFRDDKTGELIDPVTVRQVEILENDGSTTIETITSIIRIGVGIYRVQAAAITTAKTILDRWFFTVETGEIERDHTQDTQVVDQSVLTSEATSTTSVPQVLFSDVGPTDTKVVLKNSIKRIGVTFRDETDTAINPNALSLEITTLDGTNVLTDVYAPASVRSPDPPRILNPLAGVFEFPFGLDNGSTDATKKNKTSTATNHLFNWRASATASVVASVAIDADIVANNTLIWTAVTAGTPGNFISIEYIDPATPSATFSLVRTGAAIVINLATDSGSLITTTADDVIAAVALDTSVSEIVTVALPSGVAGTGLLAVVVPTLLIGGVDASEELLICENVSIITHRVCSTLGRFRLIIDKAIKLVDTSTIDSPCFLGYTEGQLLIYLQDGLQIINSYQPSGCFTFNNYPFDGFEFLLVEASLIAGVMSQQLFAVDTDIPSWNDQGNSFVIQHQPQLASFLQQLTIRMDKLIPQFKLNFVSSGSIHIEAGPNFRLATLISAAPAGSLFRNLFFKA